MATDNETVKSAVADLRLLGGKLHSRSYLTPEEIHNLSHTLKSKAAEIKAAHKRDREAARRRAERSAIYNMMESFPNDWECNPEAVRKWMTAWYKNADDLREGGLYAER